MPTLTVTTIADSGAGSLRNAIATAAAGDTIVFAASLANQTITLTSGQIEIAPGKNITIDGSGAPGLAISGNNASRIFLVNSNVNFITTATISNLTLRDAYTSDRGAAILSENKASLIVDNVSFLNNTADIGGSAIFSLWETNLTVTNSQFKNNVSIAANDERGSTIAFVSPGIFNVSNSLFENNRGINGAAINSLNGKLTITNSQFINNDTTAATYAAFDPNGNNFLRGYGGAVYTDRASSTSETAGTISITGSTFSGNRAKAEGGAAYLFTAAGQDNVILADSLFQNNRVDPLPGGNAGNGGAVNIISNGANRGVDIRNTTFAGNVATQQGGALWLFDSPTTITNSTFSGNQAGGAPTPNYMQVGGGIVAYGPPLNILNTTFADNTAAWVGGGISTGNGTATTFTNTLFSNNQAYSGFGIQQNAAGDTRIDGGGNLQTPEAIDRVLPGILVGDPKLNPLQLVNGALVHTLQPGSAAIDAGVTTGIPALDQTGAVRNQDGDFNGTSTPDIGAVENPGTPLPEIAMQNGAANIVDGTTTPINFGNALIGDTLTRTFTLQNQGTADLTLAAPTLPTGFTLASALPATLAAGTSTSVVISVDTSTAGSYSGSFSVVNNDSDESPFDFAISARVRAANSAPTVNVATPDQITTADSPFSYSLPANAFADADGDPLTLTATLMGGAPLPSWLVFNPTTGTFSGTPTTGNISTLSLDIVANDGFSGGTVTDTFTLKIDPAPIPPINGTNDADTLIGTANDDVIYGFGGHDLIYGDLGDDEIWGGDGNDKLWGQVGNDLIHGEAGNDQLYGDDGNDQLFGEAGDDQLWGGAGNDTLVGGLGNDQLWGGAGNDTFAIASGNGTDIIRDFKLGDDRIGLANGLTYGQLTITQRSSQTFITETATSQLLARLEGVNAAALMAQSATAFVSI
jgi:Ca2+-binding RTX toxin-like protein